MVHKLSHYNRLVTMAASSLKRKRLRNEVDDDADESLPISKKINGLHIQTDRNYLHQEDQLSPQVNGQTGQVSGHQPHLSPITMSAVQTIKQPSSVNNNVENRQSTSSGTSSVLHPDLEGYEPELTLSENPHYFHINEVLYRAHVDRATRTNQYFVDNT